MIAVPPHNLLLLIRTPHIIDDVLVFVVAGGEGELTLIVVLDEGQFEGLGPTVPAALD